MAYNYSLYHKLIHAKGPDYQKYLLPYLQTWVSDHRDDLSSVVDIGCGSGLFTEVLDSQSYAGSYTGIDSRDSIKSAKSRQLSKNYSFLEYDTCSFDDSFNWAFASLSFSEMDDVTVEDYIQRIKTKRFLVIQPSRWLFQYPAKAVKTLWNKASSRIGKRPQWKLVLDLPAEKRKSYLHEVTGYTEAQAHIFYRPQAKLILLFNTYGYRLTNFNEIGPEQASIKESILPKFEIFEFTKERLLEK